MRLIKKPNRWSCILSAFSMALDIADQQHLIDFVGHDGSEIIFPGLPEPMCRRGFHHQELIAVAVALDYSVTPFELVPALQSTPYTGATPQVFQINMPGRDLMFSMIVNTKRGVLTGVGRNCHHAVAFNQGHILDPDGDSYPFSFAECEKRHFFAMCAWIVNLN